MDASILTDTVGEILKWTSTLTPSSTRLSSKEIQDLKKVLEDIHVKVQKAKRLDLQWLRTVKAVVRDMEDLMDDFRDREAAASTCFVRARQSINIAYGLKVARQIKKATEELKPLVAEAVANFSFGEPPNIQTTTLSKTATLELEAVSRENDKNEIVDRLLTKNKNGATTSSVPVVTIVGIAGIGKTKLARLVCDDERVKSLFGSPRWFTEIHDAESIAKCVNDSAPATTKEGKPFLLVLDDLRIELGDNRLEELEQKLSGSGGGAILITTRSNLVATRIANADADADKITTFKPYALQGLNEEYSWTLFQQIREQASSNNNEREMVRDCVGVPQAIITLATLKNSRAETEIEAEFLKELAVTFYDELPAYQKPCFAYCSLFPQDHLIDAESLIQLWIAEGFLRRDRYPEELGQACFNDFVPLIFHQVEEEKDECGEVSKFRMNRLMHALARNMALDENITVDPEGNQVHEEMVRASFDYALDVACGIPDSLFEKAKKLRTILLVTAKTDKSRLPHEVKMSTSTCEKIFNTFKSMRVLDLQDLGIKLVPSSIGEVKYLTYLDLSNNNIERLPASVTKLSHLKTLKLSQCHLLKELPKDLEDLSSLRHLDLEGCLDLTQMPRGLSKLAFLQTLSLFVASNNYPMGGLGDLTDLDYLKGHLEILHLEQFKLSASLDANGPKGGYLIKKEQLRRLTLRWDHDDEQQQQEENNEKSLEFLEPHSNLKVLLVAGYNGQVFSNWLSSIHCLVKFTLDDCPKCKFIPHIDHLIYLKVLELRRLDSLEFIAKDSQDNNTSTSSIFFPSLRELTISDCPKLRSWWENKKKWENNRPMFSCISKLEIQCCPVLEFMPLYPDLDQELVLVDSNVRSMRDTMHADEISWSQSQSQSESKSRPPFSKLKSMFIERIQQSPPERWLKNFTSLEKLHIRECFHLSSLPQGFWYLSSLQHLTIESCPELSLHEQSGGTEWKGLKNLQTLTLREIPNLKSLPSGVGDVTSLQDLALYECSALTSLPESIGNLRLLGKLVISECKELGCLPKGLRKLEVLHTLIITDCPLLLPRCQPETGDDWQQIAHIKSKLVKQTSHDLKGLVKRSHAGSGKHFYY